MRRDVIIFFCTVFVIVNICVVLYLADYRNKCCSQLVIVSSDFVDSRGEQRFSGNWFPGCQDVCYFRADSSVPNSQAVTHILGEAELNLTSVLAQAPGPREPTDDGLLVYNVLPGTPNHPWRQIIQSASLASPPREDTVIHVVVVNKDNVVLVYNTDKNGNSNVTASETPPSEADSWTPKEVSLAYQNEIVLTEISWQARSNGGVYHVTWEVDGGGLKGHLFTDATRVTLNLWPETTYHVQVEMVSRTPDVDNDKSESLTIDTSRAKHMTEARDELELDTVKDILTNFESSMRKENISQNTSYSSLIWGCLAAISMFSLAAAAMFLWRRRVRGTSAKIFGHASPVLLNEKLKQEIPQLETLESGLSSVLHSGEHW